jgi:sugar/nucleoside kinase (ribokinase family)
VLLCTLGDLLLDVVVRPHGPLPPDGETSAATRAGPGGQAANVAAWSVALGAEARFVGKRADDAAGRALAADLTGRGVEVLGPVVPGSTGVVVSLVGADGTRTMASDRGVAPALRAEELEMRWLRGCDVLHLPAYSLLAGPIDLAAAKAAGAVLQQGGRLSVDLSSAAAIDVFGPPAFRTRLEQLRPQVVFGNEEEWEAVGEPLPFAVDRVIKRGRRGLVVERARGGSESFDSLPAEVVDTTGAGDALAAGFLVGGPRLGLEAAARCVAALGALPEAAGDPAGPHAAPDAS